MSNDINEIYKHTLIDIYKNGVTSSPRGKKIKELFGYRITIDDPTLNVITLPGFVTNIAYAEEELKWYESGSSRIDFSPKINKVWKRYSDNGENVNSAYGQYIFPERIHTIKHGSMSQWDWVKKILTKDKDSRRAVININGENNKFDLDTKDFPCTMSIQFFIRNNKLSMITHMRSNDIFYGFRNDVYTFTRLQLRLTCELRKVYPDLVIGKYIHIAGSMHLYEEQFDKVKKLIEVEE